MEDEIPVYEKTIENLEKIIEDDLLNDLKEIANHELKDIQIISSNIIKEIEFRGKNITYLQELLSLKDQVPELSMPKILAMNDEISKMQKEIMELKSQAISVEFEDDSSFIGQAEAQLIEHEIMFKRLTQNLKMPLCRNCINKE